jgi:hypothetical protein
VSDFAQYSIVTINRGSRDGVEVGHVLATMRKGGQIARSGRPSIFGDLIGLKGMETTPNPVVKDTVVSSSAGSDKSGPPDSSDSGTLPDERSGLVFVFRTFEKLSYGMVMKSVRPISVGDVVQTP